MLPRHARHDTVTTRGGLVTAPEQLAAEAGAEMLQRGGNAVDAIVATAFAAGVVEPYMSGIGGGTMMTIALRDPDRTIVVDGNMRAPLQATPEAFPLAGQEPDDGWPVSWFEWPAVVDHQNVVGPRSVAVPGTVAALCQTQERYGSLPRQTILEPAVRFAAEGFEVSWFFSAVTANEARSLSKNAACAETFLPRGLPPRGPGVAPGHRLTQPQLAESLQAIADEGPDAFYRGPIGASILEHLQADGGLLTREDLEAYRPRISEEPLAVPYGRATVIGAPVSGLPTALQTLQLYDDARGRLPEAAAWGHALRIALLDRARYMTAREDVAVPWEGLRSRDYARALLEAHLAGGTEPVPPGSGREEVPEPVGSGASGHTTQMSAVDASGNLVSLTQTVLNTYGARWMDPDTGVLLNDGMAYFDTRPGSLNGIAPGRSVFSSMMPLVLADPVHGPQTAVGASGGRRIMSGMAQIIEALAVRDLGLQEAIEEPRIHVEDRQAMVDVRWGPEAAEDLRRAGFDVVVTKEEPTTVHFARPNGVTITPDGRRLSGVDPNKPGGAVPA